MRLSYNLNLEQTQKLVMTPELRQAIEILQYNSLELKSFIQQELLNNPVLEQAQPISEVEAPQKNEQEQQDNDFKDDKLDFSKLLNDYRKSGSIKSYEKKDEVTFENFLPAETTLLEHLMLQLHFTLLKGIDNDIAVFIIENIDDNGYLRATTEEMASMLNVELEDVDNILGIIQTFDPIGVGARSLSECLMIQLDSLGYQDRIVRAIVDRHLDDLAKNKISFLAKELNTTLENIQDAGDLIRTLEPKPGRMYSSSRDVGYITPDVTLEKVNGEYFIIVKDDTAPKLTINHYYRKILLNSEMEENASEYINKKLNSALKIIRCIQQRRNTIYKVVKAIVDYQKDFLEMGVIHLKPLTLKKIADEIGVHESTVSRAINGKYLQCARGVFELKYFFQSGITGGVGEGVSSESIKSIIKDLISKENTKKPLSDQTISDELNKIGVKISRRTVAKYRDDLKIASSSKRRRY